MVVYSRMRGDNTPRSYGPPQPCNSTTAGRRPPSPPANQWPISVTGTPLRCVQARQLDALLRVCPAAKREPSSAPATGASRRQRKRRTPHRMTAGASASVAGGVAGAGAKCNACDPAVSARPSSRRQCRSPASRRHVDSAICKCCRQAPARSIVRSNIGRCVRHATPVATPLAEKPDAMTGRHALHPHGTTPIGRDGEQHRRLVSGIVNTLPGCPPSNGLTSTRVWSAGEKPLFTAQSTAAVSSPSGITQASTKARTIVCSQLCKLNGAAHVLTRRRGTGSHCQHGDRKSVRSELHRSRPTTPAPKARVSSTATPAPCSVRCLYSVRRVQLTQRSTDASAAPSLLASVPPAIARSALPPPLPPICCAT